MASLQNMTPSSSVRTEFIGKSIKDVIAPAVVLDVAVVRRNCVAMLESAKQLGVSFRAHIKSHKTRELTKLQVGESGAVKLVVSTIAELEYQLPQLQSWREAGRDVSVIYGMPAPPSSIARLIRIAQSENGPSIILLLDSPDILKLLKGSKHVFDVAVKVDTGYHRAGLPVAEYSPFTSLLQAIQKAETQDQSCRFIGFYSHRGDCYSGSTPEDAINYLQSEFEGLSAAAGLSKIMFGDRRLLLTYGATPTATALQSILTQKLDSNTQIMVELGKLKRAHELEAHAGVYPLLDLQQVATHARTAAPDTELGAAVQPLSTANIGIKALVEVASVYPDRSPRQALISAGTLALGREPCKAYPGWAIVTGWRETSAVTTQSQVYSEDDKTGWIVGKISQEHGILSWEGSLDRFEELKVGQKLLLWPNHACVTGAMFGWYLVVDSETSDGETVVDVWERGRGW